MTKLRLENITKKFGSNHVLHDVSIDISEGEFVSVLGPSGCGKTTLLKIISGLEMPCTGGIFIGGNCCKNIPAKNRGAVIVFQDYGLFPHMTVEANIEFGLVARKEKRTERMKKVAKMLEIMQIADKAKSLPHQLSGGQKQRVALARACVLQPNILLLDEPFSNLDTALKDSMRGFVQEMQRKLGITTILVTHDKEEAFMLSSRVAVLLDGHIQQFDTPKQIYASPKTKKIADFIGEANYIDGTVKNGIFTCIFGNFPTEKSEGQLMLRYSQLSLNQDDGVPCKIIEKSFKGHTTTYTVELYSHGQIQLKVNSPNNTLSIDDHACVTTLIKNPYIVICD
ncbi:MAG: ABC transporter ATP-binding protein [Defluviitaleaceae bacterium]|nr:ABC transporter ATP-binding protein [Defluviitaleaceae bacterium]